MVTGEYDSKSKNTAVTDILYMRIQRREKTMCSAAHTSAGRFV
jgi:hypothetical protein